MSLLKHSKTWPITSTMAVVQLRVDQKGRTYSTIATDLQKSQLLNCCHYHHHCSQFQYATESMLTSGTSTARNGQMVPSLGHIHLAAALNRNFTRDIKPSMKNSKKILTTTTTTPKATTTMTTYNAPPTINNISTNNNNNRNNNNNNNTSIDCNNLDEINVRQPPCYCIKENHSDSNNINGSNHHNYDRASRLERRNRSESIKVDNWDLIFIEKNKQNGGVKSPTDKNSCTENGCITGLGARKVATLRRHYYPEGDWGWIIIVVSVMVGILNHGIQLASPIFLLPAGKRFQENFVNSAGKSWIEQIKKLSHVL